MILAAAAALTLGLTPAAGAQPPRRPRPLENIKTLKGWNGDEVRAEMRLMSEALGVKCDHCHVQGNFASDEKRTKAAARRMMTLTVTLNKDYFPDHVVAAGASKFGRITCYTCHQGEVTPKQSAGSGGHR
jgi:hypothetical protein